jgi:DNA-binding NarL/FixJ family response regulator
MDLLKDTEKAYRDWSATSVRASGVALTRGREADEPGSEAILEGDEDDLVSLALMGDGCDDPEIVIYLDPRAFTRDCVARCLQASLSGYRVLPLPDPERIEGVMLAGSPIRMVLINTGAERVSSAETASVVSRVREALPGVPVAILSDHDDRDSVREAFNLGVRGYIPTSLASLVAVGAVSLVCVGGTFVPASVLLSEDDAPRTEAHALPIHGFTQRQTQILDCLRRGMANKLIAYELDMCQSTVKVHIRNIMKKLNATNRTQVVYLTRRFFKDSEQEPCSCPGRVADFAACTPIQATVNTASR